MLEAERDRTDTRRMEFDESRQDRIHLSIAQASQTNG